MHFKEKPRYKNIGGQALIEGLLMVGPKKTMAAFRRKSGKIEVHELPRPKKDFFTKLPLLRGVVALWRQLKIGTQGLFLSAELVEEDLLAEEKAQAESSFDEQNRLEKESEGEVEKKVKLEAKQVVKVAKQEDKKREKSSWVLTLGVILGLVFGIFLFIALPEVLSHLLLPSINKAKASYLQTLPYSFFTGFLRISIFLAYLASMNLGKDTRRLWEYHGAEHKTIACYEADLPFSVENVAKQSRFHPRCGTSFLFLVLLLSIFIFNFTGLHAWYINIPLRLLLLPVVAAVSFELLQWSGKHNENRVAQFLSLPGLWVQRLTTREPAAEHIEVAIEAMKAALEDE